MAFAAMWWRWGGTVSDSQAYFDTAQYLRGALTQADLIAPFPYRLIVPAIAAYLPGDVRNNFAVLNWLAITAAAYLIALTVLRLGLGRNRALLGGMLLIVSVPTFWYAPYLLVDPGSIFARSGFVLAVVSGQPWFAAAWGVLATGIREENILLLAWLIATRTIAPIPGAVSLLLAAGWLLVVRWWIFSDLPSYVWRPSLARLVENFRDYRSFASLVLAAGVVLPLAIIGLLRPTPPAAHPLKNLLVLLALPAFYAALSVRVEGRVLWSLYPLLIPFAVAATVAWRARIGPPRRADG